MDDTDDASSSSQFRVTTSVPQVVIMEGALKKRGANIAVMRDRYCVATWETVTATEESGEQTARKAIVLRTYKTNAQYAKQPEKPIGMHTLKCMSEWNGKGTFHTYPHAFLMETTEQKLFHCVAPTADEKTKWTELMETVLTPRTVLEEPVTRPTMQANGSVKHVDRANGGQSTRNPGVLFLSDDDEEDENEGDDRGRKWDPDAIHDAENELFSGDDYEHSEGHDASSVVSPLVLSPPDDKLLFRAGSSDSLTESLDVRDGRADDDEPEDWGIYGDESGAGPSRYDVVDGPVVLLDKDLLKGGLANAAAPLASDDFLFDREGPTFGAVVVTNSSALNADDDFVDPRVQERRERRHKEKQLERVTKKLESNRDLYAEMAAARLASMRKDAKTKPRPSISRRPRVDSDDSDDVWSSDEDERVNRSRATSVGTNSSSTRRLSSSVSGGGGGQGSDARASSTSLVASGSGGSIKMELTELEVAMDEEEARRRRRAERRKAREQLQRAAEATEVTDEAPPTDGFVVSFDDDLLFGEASVPISSSPPIEEDEVGEEGDGETEEEQARRRKKEKRETHKREAERLAEEQAIVPVQVVEPRQQPRHRQEDDEEEQSRLEKQRRKEERRARRENERREAEEMASAEERVRQRRETMQRTEKERVKEERRERRERKKLKEKRELDKKARQLKKKEAELQAEVEKKKQQAEEAALQKLEEEKRESRKKKRRDKYTSPADRIQRREAEAEALASEMSNALVLVETPAQTQPPSTEAIVPTAVEVATEATQTPPAPTEAAPSPVVVAQPSQPPLSAPVVDPTPATPVVAPPPMSAPAAPVQPVIASEAAVPQPPLSAPAQHPMMPPVSGYYPGYPTYPQPPPGYPMPPPAYPYSATYPAMPYPPPAYPPMPYAASAFYPTMGYPTAPMPGYVMSPPTSTQGPSTADNAQDEDVFIGPSLPSPKASSSPPPPPPSTAPSSSSVSIPASALPDLPDVSAF